MIRDATADDIPAMLAMAERFIVKAWSRASIPYDEDTCTKLLAGLIDLEMGILLIAEDRRAMLGAMIHPWHFNANVLTGTELFWWAEPGCRAGKALKEAAEWRARSLGADTFNMACEHHMRSPALERLYRIDGYQPSEHIFIKELT